MTGRTQLTALALVVLLFVPNGSAADTPASSSTPSTPGVPRVDFARDINPILSDNCFVCHGPDENARKAGLRLDIKEGLFTVVDGIAAVVPGNPAESTLFHRISSEDPDELMPQPKSGKKKLSLDKIALIRQWIEEGAEWNNHWAYVPPVVTAAPAVGEDDASFIRNDIDRFVIAKLKREGLTNSPQADRSTLIRRLSLDLTGLPPTADEVESFADDTSSDAYEKVVDRLLASPHYGERMTVYWMDLVRYADTVGLHGDQPREVWPYRDWVINAFNRNQRFDRFTIEQLAGDLLPDSTREQKVASAYNRLLLTSAEGGVQEKEYIARYGADRVRNFSTVWMGATVGCANCHDHKYDPYTQKDFFRLQAFFADIQEAAIQLPKPELALPSPAQEAALAMNAAATAEVKKILATTTPEIAAAQAAWETAYHDDKDKVDWTPLTIVQATSERNAELQISSDQQRVLAAGTPADLDIYIIKAQASLKNISAIRLEVLPHESLPANGPGRANNGNFLLSEIDLSIRYPDDPNAQRVAFTHASASIEQQTFAETSPYRRYPAVAAIDGDKFGENWGWSILDNANKAGRSEYAVFETAYNIGDGRPAELTITLKQNLGARHLLGHFGFSVTDAPRPVMAARSPRHPLEIIDVLELPADTRSAEQKDQLADHFRSTYEGLQPARDQLSNLQRERKAINDSIPKTLTTISGPPRVTRVLARGDWQDEGGEIVTAGVPQFMKQIETAPDQNATRLDLANWVVDRKNPLTARVFVNRLWKMFYGQGISNPLDDLGAQGDRPTHPELLDWLAVEFMESGWDVKHIVKLMVMSGTYRQASTFTPELFEKDPYNKLLGRQGTFRLDAEFIRDNALAIAGLIHHKIGGPSVKPYQPARYWEFLNFPKREYDQSSGDALYRRGLYTWWQRMFLNPSLLNFDASTREECVAERVRSNTPQQALTLLNDPTYVEAARVFAEKILSSGCNDDPSKIEWAFKRATAREPAAAESAVLVALLSKHRAYYANAKNDAVKIIAAGDSPVAKETDPVELAAWTSVARTLLNLHETVTRN